VRRCYDVAVAELRSPEPDEPFEVCPFEVHLGEGSCRAVAGGFQFAFDSIAPERAALESRDLSKYGLLQAAFDEPAAGSVVIRNFRPGDRIRPFGIDGSRKVHDVFIDRKLPPNYRRWWPLVVSESGEILWIPGMARSRIALVTPDTRSVLWMTARALGSETDGALPKI
jgi:tRNA(Ile)-lysidine synthase